MTTTTPERSVEIVQPKICTRTGIHTCRLGSIHLNERDKLVLEAYLQAERQKREEMVEAVREIERAGQVKDVKDQVRRKIAHGKAMYEKGKREAFTQPNNPK